MQHASSRRDRRRVQGLGGPRLPGARRSRNRAPGSTTETNGRVASAQRPTSSTSPRPASPSSPCPARQRRSLRPRTHRATRAAHSVTSSASWSERPPLFKGRLTLVSCSTTSFPVLSLPPDPQNKPRTCIPMPGPARSHVAPTGLGALRHGRAPTQEVRPVLSLGKIKLSGESYYLDAVADGIDEYYRGVGEAPGRWTGSASDGLGLGGDVEAPPPLWPIRSASPTRSWPRPWTGSRPGAPAQVSSAVRAAMRRSTNATTAASGMAAPSRTASAKGPGPSSARRSSTRASRRSASAGSNGRA